MDSLSPTKGLQLGIQPQRTLRITNASLVPISGAESNTVVMYLSSTPASVHKKQKKRGAKATDQEVQPKTARLVTLVWEQVGFLPCATTYTSAHGKSVRSCQFIPRPRSRYGLYSGGGW
jgi:hypothetical protein